MVVDDDPDLRGILLERRTNRWHRVETAENGHDARPSWTRRFLKACCSFAGCRGSLARRSCNRSGSAVLC